MDTGRFLAEVEQEIARLQHIADALRGLRGKSAASGGNSKRPMSAASRRKISLAQKERWAKQRARPKRTISAAGRRRIAAAQRKRWAKTKAQSKKAA